MRIRFRGNPPEGTFAAFLATKPDTRLAHDILPAFDPEDFEVEKPYVEEKLPLDLRILVIIVAAITVGSILLLIKEGMP